VDYEGNFVFGEYRDMLVKDEESGEWWERGNLSSMIRDSENERVDIGDFTAQMGQENFLAAVRSAMEWIAAGDIYQVNLAQGFSAEVRGGSLFGLYEILRQASPAPMGAWLGLDGKEVLCTSPELFLKISGNVVETRPIKGTRPRFRDADEDRRSAVELQTSEKEVAELVMITDLERNDLGQVCEYGSVVATELLKLERYAQVFHLVSTIEGTLRKEVDHLDAFRACLPGGSITGAPKKRAREIIAELEPEPRGIYTGAVGYFGRDGQSIFNIAIRTLVVRDGRATYGIGAGIVADSDPAAEYDETLHKAAGLFAALS
jgi:aminodeoxychorismate synthase component I